MQNIVVVGGGLVGTSVAAALARSGQAVTLVTDRAIGAGTSQATFGWFNALQPYVDPGLAFKMQAMQALKTLAGPEGAAPWYHAGGNVEWTFGEDRNAKIRAMMELMLGQGYRGLFIPETQLLALEPAISAGAIRGAQIAYYPDEGYVDVVMLIARFVREICENGGRIIENARIGGFRMAGSRIVAAATDAGAEIGGDVFVNAAGPAAGDIAAAAGAWLPMANTPGVQFYTAPTAVQVNRVLHAPGLSIRPDGGGRICVHSHDIDHLITELPDHPSALAAAPEDRFRLPEEGGRQVAERLAAIFPGLGGCRIEAARLAIRPIPRDRRPVVGWLDGVENMYACVMHSAVTQSVLVGDLASREIGEAAEIADLKPFRVSRFRPETTIQP